MFSRCRNRWLLQKLHANFLQGAPGDAAGLRAVLRHKQLEMVRDAADDGDFELGAAVGEVADHAIHPASAAVKDDRGSNRGVAPRREALFEPEIQNQAPDRSRAVSRPGLENPAIRSVKLRRTDRPT